MPNRLLPCFESRTWPPASMASTGIKESPSSPVDWRHGCGRSGVETDCVGCRPVFMRGSKYLNLMKKWLGATGHGAMKGVAQANYMKLLDGNNYCHPIICYKSGQWIRSGVIPVVSAPFAYGSGLDACR